MEWLVFGFLALLFLSVVLYQFFERPVTGERPLNELPWLQERWRRIHTEKGVGELVTVPGWYFDRPTKQQREKLRELGISPGGAMIKGHFSDLIGLTQPPDANDLEILQYFGLSTQDLNQTVAREAVAVLLSDPENSTQWMARPASTIQREFYCWINLPVPDGLTYRDAQQFIDSYWNGHDDWEAAEAEMLEWHAYEAILRNLEDGEIREQYGLHRNPGIPVIRETVLALKKGGHSVAELDVEDVACHIIRDKPELEA